MFLLKVKLLRRMLQKRGVRTGLHGVEVNSVDGFQGREKEDSQKSSIQRGKEDFKTSLRLLSEICIEKLLRLNSDLELIHREESRRRSS